MISKKQYNSARRYDIDWLRIIVIFLLFPFHTARIFDYWEPNYVKNIDVSWGLSKERISRLFIPLFFGILIIVPPQGYLAKLNKPGNDQTYFQFLNSYFRDFSDLSGYFGTFTPAHLWFILYLFIFSMIGLPLLLALKKESGRRGLVKFWTFFSNSWAFALGFIFLTATEALPAPGGKNLFFYFFLFLAGYISSADERFNTMIERLKAKVLLLLIPYIPLYLLLLSKFTGFPDWSIESIILAFIRNLALWLTLIVILGYGKQYLNFNHKWLEYMNQATFPIYVIHQTILLIIGFFVVRIDLGVAPKFLSIMVLSFFSCVVIYDLFIRRFSVMRWIFGVKTVRKRPRAHARIS